MARLRLLFEVLGFLNDVYQFSDNVLELIQYFGIPPML